MPAQKPGSSKQDYQTPPEFLSAVKRRLGIPDFHYDLAASAENSVVRYASGNVVQEAYFSEDDDALSVNWAECYDGEEDTKWMYLNPPYADITPWVQKCAEESARGAHIACLVPASTGSNWWRDWVQNHAYILFLNGRITFVGADGPYPKDCALLLYTPFIRSGSAVWNWREVA